MTPQDLIEECRKSGVLIHLDGGALKLRGAPDAVKSMAARLRPHKADLLAHLAAPNDDPDVWGEFTPYCCGISPELVHELHRLIAVYAEQYRLADDATARIIDVAKKQPLSTVPTTVEFFRNAIRHTTT